MAKATTIVFWILAAALVAAVVLLTPWVEVSQVFCEQAAFSDQGTAETHKTLDSGHIKYDVLRIARGILGFFDEHGEAFTALFTIVVALSTIALWNATRRLWLAGERQSNLLERSTEATIKSAEVAKESIQHLRLEANRSRITAINAARSRIEALRQELEQWVKFLKVVAKPNRELTDPEVTRMAVFLRHVGETALRAPTFSFLETEADSEHARNVNNVFQALSRMVRPKWEELLNVPKLRAFAEGYATEVTLNLQRRYLHWLDFAGKHFSDRLVPREQLTPPPGYQAFTVLQQAAETDLEGGRLDH